MLRMNLVNPWVRKPVIRLCNILWWLHQALHHWLDYRGSGLLTHNRPANTHTWFPILVLIKAERLRNLDGLIKKILTRGIKAIMYDMVMLVMKHAAASQTWLVMVSFEPLEAVVP